MQHFLKDLTIMLSGMAFHAADTHHATYEGAARKGRLKERCGLEPQTNFFFHLINWQKLVRIRFENVWYFLIHYIYGHVNGFDNVCTNSCRNPQPTRNCRLQLQQQSGFGCENVDIPGLCVSCLCFVSKDTLTPENMACQGCLTHLTLIISITYS